MNMKLSIAQMYCRTELHGNVDKVKSLGIDAVEMTAGGGSQDTLSHKELLEDDNNCCL